MKQQFYTEDTDDKQEILAGIEKIVERIGCTMGPLGHLVAIDTGNTVLELKDGATVAKWQSYKGYAGLAARLVIDACRRTEDTVGDGTTATAVLIQALFAEALESNSGKALNVHEFKRGMDIAVAHIEKQLAGLSVQVVEGQEIMKDMLWSVAHIASNSDYTIATLVTDLIFKMGVNGKVIVRKSEHDASYTEHQAGYVLETGLTTPQFANQGTGCLFKDPLVILINERVEFVEQIVPILNSWNLTYGESDGKTSWNPKPLVLVVQDIIGDALSALLRNKQAGTHKIAVIKAPDTGDRRALFLADLQQVVGCGNVFDQLQGIRLNAFDEGDPNFEFGECASFYADGDSAIFYTDDSAVERIEARKALTRSQVDNEPTLADFHNERLSRLSSGIGVIYVGGPTDSEHERLKTVFDDTHRACYSAIRYGVVPGGGAALIKATNVPYEQEWTDAKASGYNTVMDATYAPFYRIARNAGITETEFAGITESIGFLDNECYDVVKQRFGDCMDNGIVDPMMAPLVALKNAVSVAGNLLSTKYFQILEDEAGL